MAVGVPINMYDHLGGATIREMGELLDADVGVEDFQAWLDASVEAGNVRRIVADHISQWNQLKATTSEHLARYEEYVRKRLPEWKALGLDRPSSAMFGVSKPASSSKQPRNDPCDCGSGLKFKRCHGS